MRHACLAFASRQLLREAKVALALFMELDFSLSPSFIKDLVKTLVNCKAEEGFEWAEEYVFAVFLHVASLAGSTLRRRSVLQ
jgi:hypothetical protein